MHSAIQQAFEKQLNGKHIQLHWLKSPNLQVGICNYGARITHFILLKKDQQLDVALGFNNIDAYLNSKNEFYYGVTVGPFANRIANARFSLDGKTYQLEANNDGNCLHSGSQAFHNKVWDVLEADEGKIVMQTVSVAGEGGFPGNLQCQVAFSLNNDALKIEYHASTDEDTVVNLTNHSYFNLNGEGTGSILNHRVQINATEYLPINRRCIPLGEFAKVESTPFDFLTPKAIGAAINADNEQLKFGNGYDHSFSVNTEQELKKVAFAQGDESGVCLEVYTDQPGMQFYTGNYLSGDIGKSGKPYAARTAFCFETQHHPDSPNQPNFLSTELKAGETFKSTTIYKLY